MLLSGVYDWLQNKDTRSPGCDTLTDKKKIKSKRKVSNIFWGCLFKINLCTIKLTHRGFLFCIRRSKIILRQQQRCFCTFGASVLRTSSCSILACTRIAFEVRHICTMFVCLLIQCTFAHFRGTKRCAICRKFSLLFRITPRTCHTKKSAVREQNVSIDVTKPAFQTKLKKN